MLGAKGKHRRTTGQNAQVRAPSAGGGQFGGGPQSFDGRKNTNAGEPTNQPAKVPEGPDRVIKTNS